MQDDLHIPVSIEGLPGSVVFSMWGYAVRGKFASHTGYHSFCRGHPHPSAPSVEPTQEASRLALDAYRVQAAYPFLVGEEHREDGWKSIQCNHQGQVQVRLPDWHEGYVAAVLTQMGMYCDNELNQFWVFPETVALKDARAALRPILRPNTRLEDESILAAALNRTGREAGLLCAMEQLWLF